MSAPLLLAYINVALLFQLAVGIGVWLWRRRSLAVSTPVAVPVGTAKVSSGAWPGWRKFRVARREFEDGAHTQCSFHLEPVDGAPLPPFRPGQFLTFALQVADAGAPAQGGERTITRCYSLSDRPDPSSYRVTIKRIPAPTHRPGVPPGASSSHFHDHVHEGDVLEVKAPSGHFFIARARSASATESVHPAARTPPAAAAPAIDKRPRCGLERYLLG